MSSFTMTGTWRVIVLIIVVGLATLVYLNRPSNQAAEVDEVTTGNGHLPRLLDLGADKCVPCKMMAPILEEMRGEFASYFTVEFIDVWKKPEAAVPYAIKVIPTQIFYSAAGEELFRHEGFFSREDILAKWQELGINTGAD